MGTTIGSILISYDVDSLHNAAKDAMKELGYYDNWRYGEGTSYHLPNTTLFHTNKSTNQALADLRGVCNNLRVTLESAVAVYASEFVGI